MRKLYALLLTAAALATWGTAAPLGIPRRHSTIRHGATESAIAARATANQARVQVVMSTVCGEVGGVADVRVAVCGRVNADEDPDEETVCAKISHLYIKIKGGRA